MSIAFMDVVLAPMSLGRNPVNYKRSRRIVTNSRPDSVSDKEFRLKVIESFNSQGLRVLKIRKTG